VKIRHFIKGELLPERLRSGYETGMCEPEWIWIAESEDKPVAILVSSPAHVVAILIRIAATDDAPHTAIHMMLAHAFMEMEARGYKGYVTWVNPTGNTAERALVGMVRAAGGVQIIEPQVCCAGSFEKALKGRAA
jgi:hypothetical protein